MENIYISNNENTNKWKCGLITNNNNMDIYIYNAQFINNAIKNNGGSL